MSENISSEMAVCVITEKASNSYHVSIHLIRGRYRFSLSEPYYGQDIIAKLLKILCGIMHKLNYSDIYIIYI